MNQEPKQTSYAKEFIARHKQLVRDNKGHVKALRICEGEFDSKVNHTDTQVPTYFFIDNSCADFFNLKWELHENINKK